MNKVLQNDPAAYVHAIHSAFQSAGRPEVAEGQARYMRDQFAFFGLKMPAWTAIARDFFKTHGLPALTVREGLKWIRKHE